MVFFLTKELNVHTDKICLDIGIYRLFLLENYERKIENFGFFIEIKLIIF